MINNNNKKNIGAILQPVIAILIAVPAISSLGYMMVGSQGDEAEWDARFKTSPQEMLGVSIGMSDLEVKIAIGEPELDQDHADIWLYSDGDLYVRFNDNKKVSAICYPPAAENPVVHERLTEQDIKDRYGDPVNESVHESGLKKIMNYSYPKYSFGIQLNKTQLFCVHDGKGMSYATEYQSG